MLMVSVLRSTPGGPVIGGTEWSELNVFTKMTHWFGWNGNVSRTSTSSNSS